MSRDLTLAWICWGLAANTLAILALRLWLAIERRRKVNMMRELLERGR